MTGGRQRARGALLALALIPVFGAPVPAADLSEFGTATPLPPSAPRFFPRGDGEAIVDRPPRPLPRRLAGCAPRIAPVPTDAPDDPSYVGSAYGLGKPSYYGFRPGLGYDDPFGRPLRYCP
ncbi:hypothetical protein MPAR168_13435 [Methylorubrum populi]|uniref:Lectin-like protein BA14k n=1 Tax=Methylobacterium radiotolerans TaxID=31998 RepID=A0ABU7TCQ1_9HYPH